ncbi:hypothetical protein HYW36_02185 [Candidatus Saccharibacteria bacterium]|nr:hypothetical protein [Candidatus Saccharibacteria bacterium]
MPLLFHAEKKGRISRERIVEATSTMPAFIIGLNLSPHTDVSWEMKDYRIEDESEQVISSSGWTPYLGMLAVGKIQHSTIMGKALVAAGQVIDKYPRVVTNHNDLI